MEKVSCCRREREAPASPIRAGRACDAGASGARADTPLFTSPHKSAALLFLPHSHTKPHIHPPPLAPDGLWLWAYARWSPAPFDGLWL